MFNRKMLSCLFAAAVLTASGCGSSGGSDDSGNQNPVLDRVTVQNDGRVVGENTVLDLEVNSEIHLDVRGIFTDATGDDAEGTVTTNWESSNPDVFQITDAGDGTAIGAGTAAVTVVAMSGDESVTYTFTVNVSEPVPPQPENRAPIASAGSDKTILVNETLTLNGSASSDPDGDALSYAWSADNKDIAPGIQSEISFSTPGVYTIVLTVTDTDGLSDDDSIVVTVESGDQPPVAVIAGDNPRTVIVGEDVAFDGSASTDDVELTSFEWSFGGTEAQATHVFDTVGETTVELTVTDSAGQQSTASVAVIVEAAPYVANYTEMYMRANVDQWAAPGAAMSLVGDNLWSGELTIESSAGGELKFIAGADPEWANLPYWGDTNADLVADAGNTPNILIENPGVYTLTFNDETLAYTVEKTGDVTVIVEPLYPAMHLVGSHTNWLVHQAMIATDGVVNEWSIVIEVPAEGDEYYDENARFKFTAEGSFQQGDHFGLADEVVVPEDGSLLLGGELMQGDQARDIPLQPGVFRVVFSAAEDGALTYSVEETTDPVTPVTIPTTNFNAVYVVGSHTSWGEFTAMTASATEANVWTLKVDVPADEADLNYDPAPRFKFTLAENFLEGEFGDTDGNNVLETATGPAGDIAFPSAGTFLITFDGTDVEAPTYQVEAVDVPTVEQRRDNGTNVVTDTEVSFTFEATAEYDSVVVAGSFNDWGYAADGWEMTNEEGTLIWTLTLPKEQVLVPGQSGFAEYKFKTFSADAVDADWMGATEDEISFPDYVGSDPKFVVLDLNDDDTLLAQRVEDAKSLLTGEESVETLANFRAVQAEGVLADTLYRGISPLFTADIAERGETGGADRAAAIGSLFQAQFGSVINLSEPASESLSAADSVPASYQAYVETNAVAFVETSYQEVYYLSSSPEFGAKVASIVGFMAEQAAPYYVHCRLGKDRTGVVVAILLGMAGASWDDIVADYLASNEAKLSGYVSAELLQYSIEQFIGEDPAAAADLQSAMVAAVLASGTEQSAIDAVVTKLTGSAQ